MPFCYFCISHMGRQTKPNPGDMQAERKGLQGLLAPLQFIRAKPPPWIVSATLWTKPTLLNEKLRKVIMNRQVESERKKN